MTATTMFSISETKAKKTKLADIASEKELLEAEIIKIEQKQAELAEAERLEKETIKAEKIRQAFAQRELAVQYENWAKEEAKKPLSQRELNPEHFLNLAREARNNAMLLEKEAGVENVVEEPQENVSTYNYKLTILMQRVILLGLPVLSAVWFFWMRSIILKNNAALLPGETDAAVLPYGLDSIQKIAFSFFVRSTDLLLLYGFLKIVSPFVPDYLIPTSKSPKDAIHEFYTEITPWQRLIFSGILVSSVLLYLALAPSVKP